MCVCVCVSGPFGTISHILCPTTQMQYITLKSDQIKSNQIENDWLECVHMLVWLRVAASFGQITILSTCILIWYDSKGEGLQLWLSHGVLFTKSIIS